MGSVRGQKRTHFRTKRTVIHDQTDTFSSQMDKISEETDRFLGRKDHPYRMSAAGVALFLFISRLLASASLIGSRSHGAKSSCVVAS